jgi:hypothetical protein
MAAGVAGLFQMLMPLPPARKPGGKEAYS